MFRRKDPKFVDYCPTTCDEAVELFYKLKENGHIVWDDIDVALRQCAYELPKAEYDRFIQFVLNPTSINKDHLTPDPFPASCIAPQDEKNQDEKSQDDEKSPN